MAGRSKAFLKKLRRKYGLGEFRGRRRTKVQGMIKSPYTSSKRRKKPGRPKGSKQKRHTPSMKYGL